MAKKNTSKGNFPVVTQANQLVEAHYSPGLTTRAHKIARMLVSLISPDDKELKFYKVKVDFIKRFLGQSESTTWGSFVEEMKMVFKKLSSEPIVINREKGAVIAHFLAGVDIDPVSGYVTFEISGLLKPYLIELKNNFTSYSLAYIPALRSSYSIRVYELLSQYKKIGFRVMEVDELQRKVGSNYTLYGDFKRTVINVAQRDLEKHTDISFEFEELKVGKKVTRIKFYIYPNKPQEENKPNQLLLDLFDNSEKNAKAPNAIADQVRESILKLGIGEEVLQEILRLGFDFIEAEDKRAQANDRCNNLEAWLIEKLILVEKKKAVLGNDNPGGYFVNALKGDWVSRSASSEIKNKQVQKETQDKKRQLKGLEQQLKELQKQYEREMGIIYARLVEDEAIFNTCYTEARSEQSKPGLFFDDLFTPREQYEKGGFATTLVNDKIKEKYPDDFKEVIALYHPKLQELKEGVKLLKKELGVSY